MMHNRVRMKVGTSQIRLELGREIVVEVVGTFSTTRMR
jgi:hypothetical protein